MSKTAFILIVIGFFFCSFQTYAQVALSTDRPGATENAVVLPLGQLQIEMGYQSDSGLGGVDEINLNRYGGVVKYGVIQNAEFRVSGFQNSTNGQNGFGGFSLGTKVNLYQETKHLPNISLLTDITLSSVGSEIFRPSKSTPRLLLLWSKTMNDILSISGNLGYAWSDIGDPSFIYTLNSGIVITKDIGAFVEVYATNPSIGNTENYFDFGATIWLLEDVQLDVSYGLGLNNLSNNSFFGLGISMRFF